MNVKVGHFEKNRQSNQETSNITNVTNRSTDNIVLRKSFAAIKKTYFVEFLLIGYWPPREFLFDNRSNSKTTMINNSEIFDS